MPPERSEPKFLPNQAHDRQSDNLYFEIFHSINDAIFIHARTGEVLTANKAALSMFGVEAASELNQFEAFNEEHTRDEAVERIQAVFYDGPQVFEWKTKRKDGRYFWVEVTLNRLDISGEGCVIAVVRDISRRKQTEQTAGVFRGRLEGLLRAVPIPIFAKDAQGRYLFCNPAFEQFFSIAKTQLQGKTVHECWPSEHARVYHEKDMELMHRGGVQVYEHFMENAAGAQRHTVFSKACFYDEQGQVAGLVGAITDLTDRDRAQEERRQLENQMLLSQKLESLGILAGGIAHDFNNLLTSVLGNADLALAALEPAEPAHGNVTAILAGARRAADLCRQLLAYSGRGKFIVAPVGLNGLVHEMAHLIEVSVSKKIRLQYNLDGSDPVMVADVSQLQQIVLNLITNAAEAIGDQTGAIQVSTGSKHCTAAYLADSCLKTALPEGEYVFLEVSDTGCGMSEQTLSRIFDPFFTTKFTGRGLGLSAVLGIVRGHKGTIKVCSTPGTGTAFEVLLPASQAAVPGVKRACPEHWKGAGTILFVDDEPSVRMIGQKLLRAIGFDVLLAQDGCEAVEIFSAQSRNIRCVMLDLTMPRMDGVETLQALRKIRPDVCVIISSGYSETELEERRIAGGVAGFIQKPYPLSELTAVLRGALEKEPCAPGRAPESRA